MSLNVFLFSAGFYMGALATRNYRAAVVAALVCAASGIVAWHHGG